MEARRITLDEYQRRTANGERFTLVDVRNPQAWGESDIILPGALRVELANVEPGIARIPRENPILAYCT